MKTLTHKNRSTLHSMTTPATHTTDNAPSGSKSWVERLLSLFGNQTEQYPELQELLSSHDHDGEPLGEEARAFILAALEFNSLTAEEMCIPRGDVVFLRESFSFEECMEVFNSSRHSRLPVCRESLDDLVGFITLKDMLPHVGNPAAFSLKAAMRPCTFVPENLTLDKTLKIMRKNKVQMAMVLDEYGGTSGLITLKDILECLVGDIEDEHEQAESRNGLELMPGGAYDVDPRMELEELEEKLGITMGEPEEERDYETIGGLVLNIAGRVPQKGEKFKLTNGVRLIVLEADGRRIQRLQLVPKKHA